MNQVKTRLQNLGLLDRTLGLASDEELTAMVEGLNEEMADNLGELMGGDITPVRLRDAASRGRLDGTLEAIVFALSFQCYQDCIDQLGDKQENPSTEDLQGVIPGLIERHGLATTRMMFAEAINGEVHAAPIIRDLLKNDEVLKLPPVESRPSIAPAANRSAGDDAEREALKAKRKEAKARKQAEAQARREQAKNAKRR